MKEGKQDSIKNLRDRDRDTRIADLIFEIGMLRKTPRTGYQFLGTGSENVAEHSFRTATIGWMLARLAGADAAKVVLMCLFHDLHESRTSDFNYVNSMYNSSDDTEALAHALHGTGFEQDVLPLWEELEITESVEAQLAQDADQLDFIANLKELWDLGNPYAEAWLDSSVARLRTDTARRMAEAIRTTDHKDWWFLGPDPAWWRRKNGNHG